MDLARCYDLLSTFFEFWRLDTCELNDFMSSGVVKISEWLGCMTDFDQSLNVLVRIFHSYCIATEGFCLLTYCTQGSIYSTERYAEPKCLRSFVYRWQ